MKYCKTVGNALISEYVNHYSYDIRATFIHNTLIFLSYLKIKNYMLPSELISVPSGHNCRHSKFH